MSALAIGQRWRGDDGYLMDIVAFSQRGWPVVRHPNARGGGIETNPAWFARWERLR